MPDKTKNLRRRLGRQRLTRHWDEFVRNTRGNVAIIATLAMPAVLGGVVIGVDIAMLASERTSIQRAADAAVLAVSRQHYLYNPGPAKINQVTRDVLSANLGHEDFTFSIGETFDENRLHLELSVHYDPPIGLYQVDDSLINVDSTALIQGGGRICVIGLEDKDPGAVFLGARARLTGPTCGVYSNSKHVDGLITRSASSIKAEWICSAGGASGNVANLDPVPITDCPEIDDPFEDMEISVSHSCSSVPDKVSEGTEVAKSDDDEGEESDDQDAAESTLKLSPGTYCDGLNIDGNVSVELLPGTYVFKNNPLVVGGGATLKGDGVTLFFKGKDATLNFKKDSTIRLEAPLDGDTAGILITEDRNGGDNREYRITSDDARVLLGTIYLPRSSLIVDGEAVVADESKYTAIVVKHLRLFDGPNLVLNTGYHLTDVPIPQGIGPVGGNVRLLK